MAFNPNCDKSYRSTGAPIPMNLRNKLRFAISKAGLAGLHRKLILTYDNTKMTDGAGAQLQRIYGTYSVARLVGAAYLHAPLGRVDYQGLSALESNLTDPGFHHEFNDLCRIESDVMPADDFHKINLPDISMETLRHLVDLFDRDQTGGKPILAQLALPYGIADRFPDCYAVCKQISPFASSVYKGRSLRVALHIRRGDLMVVESHRMLPNAYYIKVAQTLAQVLEALKFDYVLELHTEVPNREFVVRPGHIGLWDRVSRPAVLNSEMWRLDEFSVLPNLVHHTNETAVDSLRQLATADILVMSRSSFSYLAGILNRNGIVLYHPFWHRAPSSWITVGPDGQFNQSKFRKAVRRIAAAV